MVNMIMIAHSCWLMNIVTAIVTMTFYGHLMGRCSQVVAYNHGFNQRFISAHQNHLLVPKRLWWMVIHGWFMIDGWFLVIYVI